MTEQTEQTKEKRNRHKMERMPTSFVTRVVAGVVAAVCVAGITFLAAWSRGVDHDLILLNNEKEKGDRFTPEMFVREMSKIGKDWDKRYHELEITHRGDMRKMDDRIDSLERGDVRIISLLESMEKNMQRVEKKLDRNWPSGGERK